MRRPYPFRRSHRRPGQRSVAALAGLGLLAGALVGCSGSDRPEERLDSFLTGWRDGRLASLSFVDPAGQRISGAEVAEQIKTLTGDLSETPPALSRAGDAKVTKDTAIVPVTIDWTLPGGQHWSYPTSVQLTDKNGEWQVVWEPRMVQEQLTDGTRLSVRRLAPAQRAAILDGAGKPVVSPQPVVVIGVQPGEVTDVPALVKELNSAFRAVRPALDPPIDLSDLPDRIKSADANAFVDVVSLRRTQYLQIKSRIYDLPGTKFRDEQRSLAPTREFARALLGTVDPVQKDDLDKNPGRYTVGDQIGHGGLQGRYEQQLAGTPGVSVSVTRQSGDAPAETVAEVFRQEPQAGTPLKTNLDVRAQNAADAALKGTAQRSALVAMRISDGAVVAAANGPGGGGENLAFTAQVPPGSTFKMVSTLGLLDQGAVGLDTPVACPKTFTVDGRSFKNSDWFELGTVPFRTDFAKSCNTAFAALAPKLGADGLAEAGRSLGLEGNWQVGPEAFTGKVSTGGSPAERAAASFGQGTTLVSPLAMAAATAAVAKGRWHQPRLLSDAGADLNAPPGPQLKTTSVEPLRTMMREVVTKGTATTLRDVPGKPVYGKTGTAEYDDNPANTHAWFVGWQGDIAFAIFVEQGGSSGATSVPIAERFLRGLPR